eukprot:gnl/MRDRNA2_/MRDRNA2_59960_c0_seq1.p1 gnl/MRDRNA2_/MRDRNA2_59960_c0~~gnl/MRDRNA2_/MRDRNA2_59960_c0_seq1.p1  ORF type:complete len:728 (-),score=132.63 gnl/MRDRNA2_/MRDRNA2_59960_c0_seq1:119-2056(-)
MPATLNAKSAQSSYRVNTHVDENDFFLFWAPIRDEHEGNYLGNYELVKQRVPKGTHVEEHQCLHVMQQYGIRLVTKERDGGQLQGLAVAITMCQKGDCFIYGLPSQGYAPLPVGDQLTEFEKDFVDGEKRVPVKVKKTLIFPVTHYMSNHILGNKDWLCKGCNHGALDLSNLINGMNVHIIKGRGAQGEQNLMVKARFPGPMVVLDSEEGDELHFILEIQIENSEETLEIQSESDVKAAIEPLMTEESFLALVKEKDPDGKRTLILGAGRSGHPHSSAHPQNEGVPPTTSPSMSASPDLFGQSPEATPCSTPRLGNAQGASIAASHETVKDTVCEKSHQDFKESSNGTQAGSNVVSPALMWYYQLWMQQCMQQSMQFGPCPPCPAPGCGNVSNNVWGMPTQYWANDQQCSIWQSQHDQSGSNVQSPVIKEADASSTQSSNSDSSMTKKDSQHSPYPSQKECPKELYSMPVEEQRKHRPKRPLDSTTVCLQNLRLNMTRKQLMQIIDQKGFKGKYNMIYVPMNKDENKNHGYAFINLTDMKYAESFRAEFEGYQMKSETGTSTQDQDSPASTKICLVDPANVKGFHNLKKKFSATNPVHKQHPSQRPIMWAGPSCDLEGPGPKCWRLFGGDCDAGDTRIGDDYKGE